MQLAICIIAMNESQTIGPLIAQLAQQTLFGHGHNLEFVVVSNGSSDGTAEVANTALQVRFADMGAVIRVIDSPQAGKARAWNLAVHEAISPAAQCAIFIDADIELADDDVLAELLDLLLHDNHLKAVSGYPLKDIAKKPKKSLVDRFSLRVSQQTPAPHSINGSLYAAHMEELRKIWLPVPTPGEDGLLSAMVHTHGFSQPADLMRIARINRPTHYFEAHSIGGFFRHERRITLGTTINGWICEHLWAGHYETHVGQTIHEWNRDNPDWVNRLVAKQVEGRFWALPPRLLTWRLYNLRGIGLGKALLRAPFSLMATILNIWPCIQANRTLKKPGSAGYW